MSAKVLQFPNRENPTDDEINILLRAAIKKIVNKNPTFVDIMKQVGE